MKRLAAAVGLAAAAPLFAAEPPPLKPEVDRADIERTQIIGHKELPKVLYIVPWKKPLPGDLSGRPRTSLIDDLLAPLDRTEFRRHLDYRDQLAPAPTSSAPQEKTP